MSLREAKSLLPTAVCGVRQTRPGVPIRADETARPIFAVLFIISFRMIPMLLICIVIENEITMTA